MFKFFFFQGMMLKGQLIFFVEFDFLMFFGFLSIEKLDEFILKGLYILDVFIYDVICDVILVGE